MNGLATILRACKLPFDVTPRNETLAGDRISTACANNNEGSLKVLSHIKIYITGTKFKP